ncbi:MAG: ZIP family metal transporter, partial [Alphaproteobacteria bacterium]
VVAIFAAGVIGGWAAGRIEKHSADSTAVHIANAFAGGVFLGAGLLHLMADSEAAFRAAMPHVDFPVVTLLAGLEFLGILLLDKVCFGKNHHDADAFSGHGSVYPFVLMVALSLHSVITGIAFGLEDHAIVATAILIAVLAHKSTAAMAIAVSFGRANLTSARRQALLFVFYWTTPLGVVIGTTIGGAQEGPDEVLTEAVFDGLAGGTFLYVAIINILSEEFSAASRRANLFSSTVVGFLMMAALAIWS